MCEEYMIGLYKTFFLAKTGEYQMVDPNASDITRFSKFVFYVRMFSLHPN